MVNSVIPFWHGEEQRILVLSNKQSISGISPSSYISTYCNALMWKSIVFTFPQMVPLPPINVGKASNFAAFSPDHKWVVVIGMVLFELAA